MAPERIYRIHRDRFQIEFNFRDARQHLGLAACQARTAARHHFHVNAVPAALAWTRLELRHAAARALDRFSMANVKSRTSWKWCCSGFWRWSGRAGPCTNAPRPCGPCSNWAKSSPNPPESGAHPGRIRRRKPHPGLPNPGPAHRGEGPCPLVSRKLFTPLGEDARSYMGELYAWVGAHDFRRHLSGIHVRFPDMIFNYTPTPTAQVRGDDPRRSLIGEYTQTSRWDNFVVGLGRAFDLYGTLSDYDR